MRGRSSCATASRSHIDVFVSMPPIDKYSAIPSMNHNGSEFIARLFFFRMSRWNACTISWPST
jgi:hypothetical protein